MVKNTCYPDYYVKTEGFKTKVKVIFRRNNLSISKDIVQSSSSNYLIKCDYESRGISVFLEISIPIEKIFLFLKEKVICQRTAENFGIKVEINIPSLKYKSMKFMAIPALIKYELEKPQCNYHLKARVIVAKPIFLNCMKYRDPSLPLDAPHSKKAIIPSSRAYMRPYQGGRFTPK